MTDATNVVSPHHQAVTCIVPGNPIDIGLQVHPLGTILHTTKTGDVNTDLRVLSTLDTDLLAHDGMIRDMFMNHDHPNTKHTEGHRLQENHTSILPTSDQDKINCLILPWQILIHLILADMLPIIKSASKIHSRKTSGSW